MLTIAAVTQLIQFMIAPVVMITTCGLLLNGIVQQYGAVDERLRGMMRERLALLSRMAPTSFDAERITQIDTQAPIIVRRHKQLHNAILLLYIAIVIMISSMFVIAIATLLDNGLISGMALALFMLGMGVMVVAVLVVIFEVRQSLRALYYEVERVISLHNLDDKPSSSP